MGHMPRGIYLVPVSLLFLMVGMSVPQPYQKSSQTPAQQTFKSPDDTFQFTYPSSYALYTGSETDRAGPACESSAACVVYPASKYAGTNFEAAAFQEREIDDAATASACLTSPMKAPNGAEFDIAAKDPKRIINGVSFLHGITSEGAMGHYMDTDLYRAFHKGRCYELAISIGTRSFENFDPGTVKEFTTTDRQRLRGELTAILDSFKFLK